MGALDIRRGRREGMVLGPLILGEEGGRGWYWGP